ncbi:MULTISPECIES: hypothetical protein [unclassified Pseudoalteromonas]|uniref:hypothetical protein n=1 Tax=unclassified Pseudoalteromonas TaxID=194690 RepID=UPI00386E55C4
MPKVTLQAKQELSRPMGARWLSIVNSTAAFKIDGEFGSLVGEVGRVLDLDGFKQVTFKNDTDEAIDFEYEISNIKVYAVGKGVVSVSNAIEVSRIRESIKVDANATVENGKMAMLPSNHFEALAVSKTHLPAGKTIAVFPARLAENRRAIIQVITDSANFTPVRIANSEDNTATGVYLSGNKNAPASFEFETQTAVFVKNDSDEDITLAGGEQWRA